MNKNLFLSITCMAILATSCTNKDKEKSADLADNPFMAPSTLEFGAPDFTVIKNRHFLPAFKEGIRQQRAEIDSIVNNPDAPTFDNTILALERSGSVLSRTSSVFFALSSAENTDSIRTIEEEVVPLLTEWEDELSLNDGLFKRVKAVYDNERANLTGEDLKLLEETYKGFVRNGAELNDENKKQLKEINSRLADLQQKFSNILTDATNAAGVWVDNEEELAGLSDAEKAQLKADAESNGAKSPYFIVITNTTQQPILTNLDNRALREKVYNASIHRSDETSSYNTYGMIVKIAKLRAQKAKLLGYPNFASYVLTDAMSQKPEEVYSFLNKLIAEYNPKAAAETKEIEAYAQKTQGTDFQLQPYDRMYYSAKMKQEKFQITDEEIKPYFNLDSVLVNGVFYAANQAYGLTFQERTDLPGYNPDVRIYNVIDNNGEVMGLFYTDFFRRPTKRGGAWMSPFLKQTHFFNQKPIIYNVCNVAKPAEGQPALLTWDETQTLFHEFGHALHGLLSDCNYRSLSGTDVARDFVEMPSQFNEYFASLPVIFDHYAKHYQTGEPMPKELKDKMMKSVSYHAAYALGENLAATSADMAWHMLTEDQIPSEGDAASFEDEALKKMNIYDPQIPPRYKTSYFRHIWESGYSAGYYAYLWTEVMAVNVADYFRKNGGVTREVGQAFRDKVLSKGNTLPLEQIFTDFTGLEHPDAEGFLKARGL